MSFSKLRIHSDTRGFAHLTLILLAAVVVGGIGVTAWRVSSYTNNKKNEGGKQIGKASSNTSESNTPNTATISDDCVKQTGDENICRLGAISDLSDFASEVKLTMEGADGPLTSTIKYDGKGNHIVDTGLGNQGISIGGKYYISMNDKWYDSGNDSSQVPKSSVPSFGFATTAGIKYENLGKEKCGNDTCFKYKMTGGLLADGVVTATFGDKDFLIRRLDSTGGLIGKLSMTVEYKDVTITAPANAKPISSMAEDMMAN